MSSILEGESLLNDASSLIIFRFAILAVTTGQFVWWNAGLSFAWMMSGGIAVGLIVGWGFIRLHKSFSSDVNVDIIFTIVSPYVMYLLAERIQSSGVVAVVSGGLFLSTKRYVFLKSGTRVRGSHVWESLTFVLNGLVFMLIGLELPEITNSLKADSVTLSEATGYGLLVTAILIISRVLFSLLTVAITLVASRFITVTDSRNPGYEAPLIFGWAGMRGVVSLAAALSIPLCLPDGAAFPNRSLILFITFIVILTTLLLQGLTLPVLIKKLKLPDYGDHMSEREAEKLIINGFREKASQFADDHSKEPNGSFSDLQRLIENWAGNGPYGELQRILPEVKDRYLKLLDEQRKWLLYKNRTYANLDEDVVRRFLLKIDLEEARINHE